MTFPDNSERLEPQLTPQASSTNGGQIPPHGPAVTPSELQPEVQAGPQIDPNLGAQPQDRVSAASDEMDAAQKLSLVREKIAVHREKIVTGVVRVEKTIHSEISRITCPIREETVSIKRVQKNEHVEEEYEARQVGDTWIIPVFEYVPITYNQLVLKEEVHVTTTTLESLAEIDVPVDVQRIKVSRKKTGEETWTPVEEYDAQADVSIEPRP